MSIIALAQQIIALAESDNTQIIAVAESDDAQNRKIAELEKTVQTLQTDLMVFQELQNKNGIMIEPLVEKIRKEMQSTEAVAVDEDEKATNKTPALNVPNDLIALDDQH